jgi:hypothetical protein
MLTSLNHITIASGNPLCESWTSGFGISSKAAKAKAVDVTVLDADAFRAICGI